ncbi:hypothetical protein BDN72DRAFT_869889 [Pluteus cervinus]|uniref:Uncharacterized protein n=1 Tax=Pluteus cervinus TaxID=181527 RepID=A0ACD3B228_9AGAR|nr:hypothetical protein BDN72DRAFT_869889 [Pluteus cervinus]
MNRDQEQARSPSPRSNGYPNLSGGSPGASTELKYLSNWSSAPHSAPGGRNDRQIERPNPPTRASTTGSTEPDRNHTTNFHIPQARSEDLNHGSPLNTSSLSVPGSSPRPSPGPSSLTSSRPTTPGTSTKPHPSSSGHSDDSNHRPNDVFSHHASPNSSYSQVPALPSGPSSQSAHNPASSPSSSNHPDSSAAQPGPCAACGRVMEGSYVRALGARFHLDCFKCMVRKLLCSLAFEAQNWQDCGDVVASKFFPIDGPDGSQQPLCERDFFRRLNLICAKCGMALRASYITACNRKYHVEHFTCSLCPTVFGPQDSYYEHDNDVFCHFHYSTRFAVKCAGCNSAILKQFVEINRNMRDECWHPECYMINKFWNVKVVSRRPTSAASLEGDLVPSYIEEEQKETAISLKDKQLRMEQQVYRIWTVLSAFEESSAACISEMLRQVSNGQYLEAIRMAEKFILHVEVLFATIDDIDFHFARLNLKGMLHGREARMLCRKTVELFTLLSHTQETGSRRMGMTQELLALVTGIAHYLKILIRIALTGALKLEREKGAPEAMASFLDKLHLLAVQGSNPTARRLIKSQNGEMIPPQPYANQGTQGVTYGFRSLAPENAGDAPFNAIALRDGARVSHNPPSDLCVRCNLSVEEDCVRLGTYQRWHSQCIQCTKCGKTAAVPVPSEPPAKSGDEREGKEGSSSKSSGRRPPANVGYFSYDADSKRETSFFGEVPTITLCNEHSHANCRGGFQAVQRLEQYAFLLNVALRRLHYVLKQQGVVQEVTPSTALGQIQGAIDHDPYRNSSDIIKSAHLDRKLSATARVPKRSTIIESPTGRSVHPTEVVSEKRVQEMGHPHLHQQYSHSPAQNGHQFHYIGHGHGHVSQSPPQDQQTALAYAQTSPPPPQSGGRPRVGKIPPDGQPQGQVIRPPFARNNTGVLIVDDSAPNSPSQEKDPHLSSIEDNITLADIPQVLEVAQAREQRRSLPRQNSIPYIAELSPLELAIVKHCAVLVLSRSPLKEHFDLDEVLEMVELKKSGFWTKLFKGDKKNVKKKGVFGVPLELLVEREGSDSMLGATRAPLPVPSFIDDVISAMRQMDMSIEGIFRKNGNIRRLKELTEAIDRDPASVDLTQDNPVQLAALLKKFLRDLPDPLMTYKLHRLWIATQSPPQEADRRRYLHMVSLLLPKSHRDTLEVLFVFLKWVASFAHMDAETGSKMDLDNLATVICPSIIYSRGQNAMRDETFGALRVVTALLENQDEYFTVPEEFLSILHDQEYFANSMDLPAKDFMKKCDTYMRLKANGSGRPPPLGPFTNGPPVNGAQRYPALNSPALERPSMNFPPSGSGSDRSMRPQHPGFPPSNASYSSSGSPALPQGSLQNIPRQPPQPLPDDWTATPPRPIAMPTSSSPRPQSLAQLQPPTRPSVDQNNSSAGPMLQNNNGYPSAVRQWT